MTVLPHTPCAEDPADRQGWRAGLTTTFAAAGLWILSRPFTFIENDGKLYAFMALARRAPATLGQDLFLKFGSQDAYSAFSPIYAAMIGLLGLTGATATLLFASAALWLLGCWRLANSLMDLQQARLALIVFSCLRLLYGGSGALYLGQGFLTSRILAEALVLLALAEWARGAWVRAGPLFVAAVATHPLMAIGGLAVALLAESLRRPWLIALGLIMAVCALALFWIDPRSLDWVLKPMAPDWFAIVQHQNGFIFLSSWTLVDWGRSGGQLATVCLAALRTRGWPLRFFIATIGTALAGLAACYIGADLLHIARVTQLQLWRLTWPLTWACVPALVILLPRSGEPADWVTPSLLALSIFGLDLGWPCAGLALPAVVTALLKWRPSALLSRTIVILAASLLLLAFALPILNLLMLNDKMEHPLPALILLDWLGSLLRSLLAPFVGVGFILLVRRAPRFAVYAAAALFTFAAVTWDQRQPWERNLMQPGSLPTARGPILWGLHASPAWFLFGQPAFVSLEQASGLPFSEKAARLWQSRVDRSTGIVPQGLWRSGKAVEECADENPPPSATSIRSVCAGQDPPGAIISDVPVNGLPSTAFETPAERLTLCRDGAGLALLRSRRFYISACGTPPIERRPS